METHNIIKTSLYNIHNIQRTKWPRSIIINFNFESCSWKPPLCHKTYFAGGGICGNYLTRWDCGIYRLSHWWECVATISPGCLWNTLPEDCREVEFKNLQVVFIFIPHHKSYLIPSRPQLSALSSLLSGRNHRVHDHNLGHCRQCQDERGHHKGVVDESDIHYDLHVEFLLDNLPTTICRRIYPPFHHKI